MDTSVLNEKADKAETYEDGAAITGHEDIIRINKKNINGMAYQQGKVFKRFKEKEKFIQMINNLNVNKSSINFKMNMLKLIDKYPRLMNHDISDVG